MIATSRWTMGTMISLLLAILGAVALTMDRVGVAATEIGKVGATVTMMADTVKENAQDIDDIRREVHQLERDTRR